MFIDFFAGSKHKGPKEKEGCGEEKLAGDGGD